MISIGIHYKCDRCARDAHTHFHNIGAWCERDTVPLDGWGYFHPGGGPYDDLCPRCCDDLDVPDDDRYSIDRYRISEGFRIEGSKVSDHSQG